MKCWPTDQWMKRLDLIINFRICAHFDVTTRQQSGFEPATFFSYTGYKELGRVNMKLQGGRRGAVLPSILRPSPSNSYFADVMNGGVGENDHLNDRNYCN